MTSAHEGATHIASHNNRPAAVERAEQADRSSAECPRTPGDGPSTTYPGASMVGRADNIAVSSRSRLRPMS